MSFKIELLLSKDDSGNTYLDGREYFIESITDASKVFERTSDFLDGANQ